MRRSRSNYIYRKPPSVIAWNTAPLLLAASLYGRLKGSKLNKERTNDGGKKISLYLSLQPLTYTVQSSATIKIILTIKESGNDHKNNNNNQAKFFHRFIKKNNSLSLSLFLFTALNTRSTFCCQDKYFTENNGNQGTAIKRAILKSMHLPPLLQSFISTQKPLQGIRFKHPGKPKLEQHATVLIFTLLWA